MVFFSSVAAALLSALAVSSLALLLQPTNTRPEIPATAAAARICLRISTIFIDQSLK